MENIKNLNPVIRFKNFTNDWEQRKLKNIVNFSKGKWYSKGDIVEEGTPIILYGSLYTDFKYNINNVQTFTVIKNNSVISKGLEVIIPSSGETPEDIARASAINQKDVIIGSDLNVLVPKNSVGNIFLAMCLSNGNGKRQLIQRAQGKSIVHLYNSDLENVKVSIPDLEEQEKITKIILDIDNLITLHQRKLEKLELTKRTFFKKMFPKNTNMKQDYRFSGFTDKWELRRLRDISEIKGGYAFASAGYSEEGLYRVVTIANVSGSKYIENFGNNINISDEKIINQYLLNKDDLLISLTGNVGRVSRATGNNEMLNQRVAKIVPKKGLDYNYLETLIRDNKFEVKMTISGQGAAQKNINNDDVLDYECYIPSFAEQQRIGGIFNTIDNLIILHQRKLEKLVLMKKYFLKNMFI